MCLRLGRNRCTLAFGATGKKRKGLNSICHGAAPSARPAVRLLQTPALMETEFVVPDVLLRGRVAEEAKIKWSCVPGSLDPLKRRAKLHQTEWARPLSLVLQLPGCPQRSFILHCSALQNGSKGWGGAWSIFQRTFVPVAGVSEPAPAPLPASS